jgi:LEA14-like dessication related protein
MRMANRWTAWLAGVLVLVGLGGCAGGMMGGAEPVSVTVSDLRMGTAGVLEQQYFVTLRIQNPNDREFAVKGVVFDLELNDKSFARGTAPTDAIVPRFGSTTVEVETLSSLTGILRQLGGVTGPEGLPKSFRYRIKGKLHTAGMGGTLPFDERGELSMPGSAAAPK